MYKIAVKSFDGEKIQEAIALSKKDLDKKKNELKLKSNEIEVQKKSRLAIIEQIKYFDPLIFIREEFQVYDRDLKVLPHITDWNNNLVALTSEITQVEKVLGNFSPMEAMTKAMEQMKVNVQIVNGLTSLKDKIDTLNSEIQEGESVLKHFNGLGEFDIQAHTNDRWKLQTLVNWNNQLLSDQADIDMEERKLAFLGPEFNDILSMVRNQLQEEDKLKWVTSQSVTLSTMNRDITVLEDNIKVLGDLPENTQYLKDVDDIQILEGSYLNLKQAVELQNAEEEKLKQLTEEIAHLQHMVDNNICPTCGSHVDECSSNEHKH
jgi:hypothetical protein